MDDPGVKYAETTIGEHTFGLNTLPATKALECFGVVLDVIGPGGAHLVDLFNAVAGGKEDLGALDAELDGEVLSKAVSALTCKLDARTINTMKTLLSGLKKDGSPVMFDLEFSGNFEAFPELIKFALTHNYKSFFGSALFAGLAERARGKYEQVLNRGPSGA